MVRSHTCALPPHLNYSHARRRTFSSGNIPAAINARRMRSISSGVIFTSGGRTTARWSADRNAAKIDDRHFVEILVARDEVAEIGEAGHL